jgi:hypothetical protein
VAEFCHPWILDPAKYDCCKAYGFLIYKTFNPNAIFSAYRKGISIHFSVITSVPLHLRKVLRNILYWANGAIFCKIRILQNLAPFVWIGKF